MTDRIGTPKNYKVIQTADNSKTLWSEKYQESCHSIAGAYSETLYNYIEGCQVKEKIQMSSHINIFEVGLGVGTGLKVLIDYLEDNNLEGTFDFISTEIDKNLVDWIISTDEISSKDFPTYQDLVYKDAGDLQYYEAIKNKSRLIILLGNARSTLISAKNKGLVKNVNAIFQDAFSPKKNPELWTVQWFNNLKEVCSSDVILSTYSAASSIRKSLLNSGWSIFERTGFSIKRSSTIAKLNLESDFELIKRLDRSPLDALTDQNS